MTDSIKTLKEDYKKIQNKYNLPEYQFLNENFEIEVLAGEETELLIKKVRKQILEKISSALRALELFLNPQNAPVFIFSVIKAFSKTDKEMIEQLYHIFSEFEILAFGLENNYNEEKEADFINKVCKVWPDVVADFDRIFNSMRVNYKKDSKKNDKSYLG